MGPTTLFDKSFLQSLTLDESVWFDQFFYSVICPIFYVETLADLGKEVKRRTPEQEVGIIADKFPEMHGTPTAYHMDMAINSLLGNNVPLTGQIPIAGGRLVKSGGKKGVVFDQSPEARAFLRWQKREFAEIERYFAREWRSALKNYNGNEIAKILNNFGITGKSCKSLEDAKTIADEIVNSRGHSFDKMQLAILALDVPTHLHRPIIERWSIANYPSLKEYAPYANYVLTVNIFYQIAVAASLESAERPSNRTDIAYLYYLPFCMIFISSDRLHERCAKLFLRKNQDFANGRSIKKDLALLNSHFSELTDDEKAKGIGVFGRYPVPHLQCEINTLWDKHIDGWRDRAKEPHFEPVSDPGFAEKLRDFANAPSLNVDQINFDPADSDLISLQRMMGKKKGSWWQIPKNLKIP